MRPDPLPELIAPFVGRPEAAGVICDFDGTLAAIVLDPDAARPLPGAPELLDRLARRFALVALVSGRPVSFLAEHVGRPGVVLRGLYGMDGDATAERWRSVVTTLVADALAHAPEQVLVEDKGLSLTIHYRTAPEHEAWVTAWTETAAERTGMLIRPARMSVELLPPVTIDKGTTVAALTEGLEAVCFIGDDLGDLHAFSALDRLAADGVTTLKVAVRSPESPPELLATADLLVDGPPGTVELLERLADALDEAASASA